MAAAVSIARWPFSEASSGTTPTTVADDTGNGNTLTIDYSSGDATWTSNAAGNGLDYTAASPTAASAACYISDIGTTGNISTSLNGATEMSFIIQGDWATPSTGNTACLAVISIDENTLGSWHIVMDDARRPTVRWGDQTGTYRATIFSTAIGAGVRTLVCRIDTSQGTDTNRIKLSDNDSALTVDYTDVSLNLALGLSGYTYGIWIGNRASKDMNVDGPIYYAELFTGYLTDGQVTSATTALASDNDADWAAAGGSNANLMAGKFGALLAGKL